MAGNQHVYGLQYIAVSILDTEQFIIEVESRLPQSAVEATSLELFKASLPGVTY